MPPHPEEAAVRGRPEGWAMLRDAPSALLSMRSFVEGGAGHDENITKGLVVVE